MPDQVVDQPTGAPTDAQLNAAVAYLKAKIARSSATDALPFAA